MNGLLAEFFHCAGPVFMGQLTLQTAWRTETIPEDWKNSLLVVLYKGEGPKNDCSNYRGISLLSVVGKIRIIFKRINLHIADNVLPESQCGFRSGRGTVDMIFTIRQLQEKCQKECRDLFQVFFTKAFDTVNREALWLILGKLGCPEKLISILKLFHHDMKTTLNIGGKLAEPFTVENGVKQGDTLAPTLFALYFSMVFQVTFKDSSEGVYIYYRTTGKSFLTSNASLPEQKQ